MYGIIGMVYYCFNGDPLVVTTHRCQTLEYITILGMVIPAAKTGMMMANVRM